RARVEERLLPVPVTTVALATNFKIGATAAIHPDAAFVITPRAPVDAGRVAALAQDPNAGKGVGRATAKIEVVRRAIENSAAAVIAAIPIIAVIIAVAPFRSIHDKVRAAATVNPNAAARN